MYLNIMALFILASTKAQSILKPFKSNQLVNVTKNHILVEEMFGWLVDYL